MATEPPYRGIASLTVLVLLALPAAAPAQAPPSTQTIGTVTALRGQATVTRATAPSGAQLRFRDDIFFRDQITTREHSTVRLLLSGRGVLTVREQSQVTLEESQGPDGRRSVITLHAGKIGAAIVKSLMRPGERIEIHTPNSVAAVRGTVFIVEYIPPAPAGTTSLVSRTGVTNCFVLSGTVAVSPHGQTPVLVGAQQSVTVAPVATGVQVGPVRPLSAADMAGALKGLETERAPVRPPQGGETLLRATAAWVSGQSSSPAPQPAPEAQAAGKAASAEGASRDPRSANAAAAPPKEPERAGGETASATARDSGRPSAATAEPLARDVPAPEAATLTEPTAVADKEQGPKGQAGEDKAAAVKAPSALSTRRHAGWAPSSPSGRAAGLASESDPGAAVPTGPAVADTTPAARHSPAGNGLGGGHSTAAGGQGPKAADSIATGRPAGQALGLGHLGRPSGTPAAAAITVIAPSGMAAPAGGPAPAATPAPIATAPAAVLSRPAMAPVVPSLAPAPVSPPTVTAAPPIVAAPAATPAPVATAPAPVLSRPAMAPVVPSAAAPALSAPAVTAPPSVTAVPAPVSPTRAALPAPAVATPTAPVVASPSTAAPGRAAGPVSAGPTPSPGGGSGGAAGAVIPGAGPLRLDAPKADKPHAEKVVKPK